MYCKTLLFTYFSFGSLWNFPCIYICYKRSNLHAKFNQQDSDHVTLGFTKYNNKYTDKGEAMHVK